jgi:DNA-binding transcriptional regulator GbsR (MarR family)
MTSDAHDHDPDRAAVLRFAEQFGLILNEIGMSRMPARVFAYVLADDAEGYTASELADGLQVSPAAISGAVRTLVQAGLLGRERTPGSRVDHYRVYDSDVWSAIMSQRMPLVDRTISTLEVLVADLDQSRPGGKRALETLEFYRFMRVEQDSLMERWRKHRAEHHLNADA